MESNIYENMNKKQLESIKIKRFYMTKLAKREIDFNQFVKLSELPENKYLKNLSVLTVLSNMSGWTKSSSTYAMTSYSIPLQTKIKDCSNDDYLLTLCNSLFESNSSTWQKRIKAPKNWPWNGNIIEYIIAQYNNDDLPRSLEKVNNESRFSIGNDTLKDVGEYNSLNDIFSDIDDISDDKNNKSQYNDDNKINSLLDVFTDEEDDDLNSLLDEEDDKEDDELLNILESDDSDNDDILSLLDGD